MLPNKMRALIDECDHLDGKFTQPGIGKAFADNLAAAAKDLRDRSLTVLLLGSPQELAAFAPRTVPAPGAGSSLILFDPKQGVSARRWREVSSQTELCFGAPRASIAPASQCLSDDLFDLAWVRLLVGSNVDIATLSPAMLDYLQQFVDVVVLAPCMSGTADQERLAYVLNNVQALVIAMDVAVSSAVPLARVLNVSAEAPVLAPAALSELLARMRDSVIDRRCITFAESIQKQLQYEGQRMASALSVTRLAPNGQPERAAVLDQLLTAVDRTRELIKELVTEFAAKMKSASDINPQLLISSVDGAPLVWTLQSGSGPRVVKHQTGYLSFLLPRHFTLNLPRSLFDEIEEKIARATEIRMGRDAGLVQQLSSEIASVIDDYLRPAMPAAMDLPALAISPLEVPSRQALIEKLNVEVNDPEKLERKGLVAIFSVAQSKLQKVLTMALLLFGSFWQIKRQQIELSWIAATVGILMLVQFLRLPKLEEQELTVLHQRLKAHTLKSVNDALKASEAHRVAIHNETMGRWTRSLDEFWTIVRQRREQFASAAAAELLDQQRRESATAKVLQDKLSSVDAAIEKASQCVAGLRQSADQAIKIATLHFGATAQVLPVAPGPVAPVPAAPPVAPVSAAPRDPHKLFESPPGKLSFPGRTAISDRGQVDGQ